MTVRHWAPLLLAWLLGIATALGYVEVTGGMWEHQMMTAAEMRFMGSDWQPVPGASAGWVRRPRFGWLSGAR